MVNLEWNVYIENVNANRIEPYNIFLHRRFLEDCRNDFRVWFYKEGAPSDTLPLQERIRMELQYYFWSKCEWEVIVSGWPPNARIKEEKIDVYGQVMLNFPAFFDYLMDHKFELMEGSDDD